LFEVVTPKNFRRSARSMELDPQFTFTTLIDTDDQILSFKRRKRKRLLGTSFKLFSPNERKQLMKAKCDEIKYTANGIQTKLATQDIVVLKNGDIQPVTRIFQDGRFCLRKQRAIFNLRDIAVNLSIVNDHEQDLMDRNRYWCEGFPVQVYSQTSQSWCDGKIEKVFYIEPEDELVVHADKWYSLSYMVNGNCKYKQLPWHSRDIRAVVSAALSQKEKKASCSSFDENSACSDSLLDFGSSPSSATSSVSTASSFRNSIFE